MRSGPQKYPGANTKHWYQDNYDSSPMETNVVTWHSTEGRSLPSYADSSGRQGAISPNLTAVPDFAGKKLLWYQHFDFDMSSRALANLRGGVETNTLNNCQVEIVGTCDESHANIWKLGNKTYRAGVHYLYMGNLPDWAIRDLAVFVRWAHDKHNVPYVTPSTWKAYPDSYGSRARNGVRMTSSEWNNFRGHCGHQHVPENDHGDPGNFPMTGIINLARLGGVGNTPSPTKPEPPQKKPGDRGTLGSWPGSPPVKYGNKHEKIRVMQLRLRQALGTTKAEQLNPHGATGHYGNETKAMVKYALRNHRETWNEGASSHDGIVGRVSWDVINHL